ncbi:unnamed protein product [Parnassius apollo]|uniref:(apollo) hypothetical protein n=1 Tax=Parnassius apollo TaxID=110799 RepID=A0A8S3XLN9_PARAO|nr:unnamed protein product [Parnassius apollo]
MEGTVLQTIKDELKLECDRKELETVRRMGKYLKDKVRPIVVTFTTYGRKITILKIKKYIQTKTIYMKEDFSTSNQLQEQLKKEKEAGKIAFLRYDKLIVRELSMKDSRETEEE